MYKALDRAEAELPCGEAERLRNKAAQCRRLAIGVSDRLTVSALHVLAEEYDREAARSAMHSVSD